VPRRAIVLPLREMGLGEGLNLGRAAPTPPGPGEATGFDAPAVQIELTPSQILHVCEVAAGSESEAGLRGGLAADARRLCDLLNEVTRSPRPNFSKSLVSGLYVLASLPDDGRPVGILKLAKMLGMSNSTLHRYLHTLIAAQLVQRNETTREYSLAPELVADPAAAVEDK
jgi:IclR helix-turn-helix domain